GRIDRVQCPFRGIGERLQERGGSQGADARADDDGGNRDLRRELIPVVSGQVKGIVDRVIGQRRAAVAERGLVCAPLGDSKRALIDEVRRLQQRLARLWRSWLGERRRERR